MSEIDFITTELIVDFLEAELIQQTDKDPKTYRGAACIYSINDQLFLKMYSRVESMSDEFMKDFPKSTPGKVIPNERFFCFLGQDLHGNKWEAKNIKVNGDLIFEANGRIINSEITSVKKKYRNERKTGRTTFHIKSKIKFPCNEYVPYKMSEQLIGSKVQLTDGDIYLITYDNHTEIIIDTNLNLKNDHILDAISIATGVLCSWSHMKDSTTEVFISNKHERLSKKIPAPFSLHHHHHKEFTTFIESYTAQGNILREELFPRWALICDAKNSFIDVECLVLTTSIEGIIQSLYKKEVTVSDAEIKLLNDSIEHLNKCNFEKTIEKRIRGLLEQAQNPNASSSGILHELEKMDVINKHHIESWNSLRHKAAHGQKNDWYKGEYQKVLDNYHSCLHLFYILCFYYIGYEGKHKDYSTYGIPNKLFPLCAN